MSAATSGPDGVQYTGCTPTERLVQTAPGAPTYYEVTAVRTAGALAADAPLGLGVVPLYIRTAQGEIDNIFNNIVSWSANGLVPVSPRPQVEGGILELGWAIVVRLATAADVGYQVGELPQLIEDHTSLRVSAVRRLSYAEVAAGASGTAIDEAQQAAADAPAPGSIAARLDGVGDVLQTLFYILIFLAALWVGAAAWRTRE